MATNFYYKDLDLSFTKNSKNDIIELYDLDAIKVSIYNILNIDDNENFFEDGFGISIKQILSEPMDDDTISSLQYLVDQATLKDDRILSVEEINITPNYTTQEYKILIKVKLRNLIDPQDIDLILKKTR